MSHHTKDFNRRAGAAITEWKVGIHAGGHEARLLRRENEDLRAQLAELTSAFYFMAFIAAFIMASIAAAALAVWFSI